MFHQTHNALRTSDSASRSAHAESCTRASVVVFSHDAGSAQASIARRTLFNLRAGQRATPSARHCRLNCGAKAKAKAKRCEDVAHVPRWAYAFDI